jgi:uncharacterized protein (TIGR00730 family)
VTDERATPPADEGASGPAGPGRPRRRAPLAYRDRGFLDSNEGRPVRILSEYLQPLRALRRHRIRDTIVFFGSARVHEGEGPLRRYYDDARELARRLTDWSDGLPSRARRYVVCTGGGPGLMEAANRGARDAGGRSIGLNIGLPYEQYPNPYITRGLCFEFRYFFMRKLWFAYPARAIVVFPGGYGTLDELFELLTLQQTGKLDRPILIVLYGTEYWREVVDFNAMARYGTIDEDDLSLLHFVDTPQAAFDLLRQALRPEDTDGTSPAVAESVTPRKSRAQTRRGRKRAE